MEMQFYFTATQYVENLNIIFYPEARL